MPVRPSRSRPSWDVPRAAGASRHLLETGAEHGVDARSCLAGTGLAPADLDDPDTEVQASQELAIARNLLARVGDVDGLGIDAGLRYTITNAGILGYAMLASPTVRDAAAIGLRYAALSSIFVTFSLHETDTTAVVDVDDSEVPADVRHFLLERDLAAIAHVLPVLLGDRLYHIPAHLRLRLPEPPGNPLARLDLAATIEFDADRTSATVPRALLDEPMPAADPHTAQLCVQQCERLLDRRHRLAGIAARVRTRLLRARTPAIPMADVARELGMTERTLHRRLAAEGTGYRALVSEVREALAMELLDSGLSVEQVASRLGYAETGSFTHAYTRWRGHPPSEQARRAASRPRG
ncbi:AraC family transcriptional regulator [Haloechinothrix sp. LS1_15]|uniref:AraC family transcriptional regulator n=1 Tax=Haloechinothrix sp. LS1_15 TaxID=2652248 RepID=UPI0029470A3B|nr:AraC family transcriptional regulator [Haloechinothrix sp. LS1_15]MDV6012519.1 AraC family transcriptional regulator [Haloechinothrix sp. LS1_15]